MLRAGNYTPDDDLVAHDETHVSQILLGYMATKKDLEVIWFCPSTSITSSGMSLGRQNLESARSENDQLPLLLLG